MPERTLRWWMPCLPERAGQRLAVALLGAVAAFAAGCVGYARTPVSDSGGVKVILRELERSGEPVPRGFAHPATIAGVRIAHILSRVDVRLKKGEGERRAAIPTELIFQMGDAISTALAQANPNQEVVVQAVRKARNLGLFTERYATSLILWVQAEDLVVHLSRADDLLSKEEENDNREPKLGVEVQAFKVVPAEGIRPVGPQSFAADWRNPVFREATNLRIGPRGKVMRREVLMEEAPPETEGDPGDSVRAVPSDPQTLRALADLEDRRRQGLISEGEYQVERGRLLRGPSGP